MRRPVLVSALLIAFAAVPAAAQTATDADPATTGAIAPDTPPVAPVTDWIGKPVVSADGVEVGTVADVRVDADGRPAAVVTEVGGFLGFGARTVELTVDDADFDGDEVRLGMVETDINALADQDPAE